MKKFFMFAMAAVAMLSVSSCLSEEEVNLTASQEKGEGYGYISLNATTDAILTRADAVPDITKWYAKVSQGETYKWGAADTYSPITEALGTTSLPAVSTTVEVANFETEAAAYQVNPDDEENPTMYYGTEYWTGSLTKVIAAGTTPTSFPIECGAPANSKLTITKTGFTGANLKVYITDPRSVTFSGSTFNNGGVAYFPAGTVKLYITYDFGGVTDKRWPADEEMHSVTLTAGHASTLNFTMNSNGTISLTITTEGYEEDEEQSLIFDAVDGSKVEED